MKCTLHVYTMHSIIHFKNPRSKGNCLSFRLYWVAWNYKNLCRQYTKLYIDTNIYPSKNRTTAQSCSTTFCYSLFYNIYFKVDAAAVFETVFVYFVYNTTYKKKHSRQIPLSKSYNIVENTIIFPYTASHQVCVWFLPALKPQHRAR